MAVIVSVTVTGVGRSVEGYGRAWLALKESHTGFLGYSQGAAADGNSRVPAGACVTVKVSGVRAGTLGSEPVTSMLTSEEFTGTEWTRTGLTTGWLDRGSGLMVTVVDTGAESTPSGVGRGDSNRDWGADEHACRRGVAHSGCGIPVG